MTAVTIQQQGAVVHYKAGQYVVEFHGQALAAYPSRAVTELLLLGGTHLTTHALREAASQGVPVHFLTMTGRPVASVQAPGQGGAALLRAQVYYADTPARTLEDARQIVHAKIRNSRWVLQQAWKSQPERRDTTSTQALNTLADTALLADSQTSLLGIEGVAAQRYFAMWRELLPLSWQTYFSAREAHPAADPVNALLSLGYGVLTGLVQSNIQRLGLHPGFAPYHQPHGRRPVLALDLVEEFRAYAVDSVALTFMTVTPLTPDLFSAAPNARLSAAARKSFLTLLLRHWQKPWLKKASLAQVVHRQVSQFAQCLREEKIYKPLLLDEAY